MSRTRGLLALIIVVALSGCLAPPPTPANSPGSVTSEDRPVTAETLPTTTPPSSPPPSSTPPSSTPPSSTPPSSTPPSPPAQPSTAPPTPVLTLTSGPNFFCPTTFTQIPTLVVYDDGSALWSDSNGSYCDPVPTVHAGRVSLEEMRERVEDYLASPEAGVNMMGEWYTDGAISTLAYRSAGQDRSVDVYGLGDASGAGSSMSVDERQARSALFRLWRELSEIPDDAISYQPQVVVVGSPELSPMSSLARGEALSWPFPEPPPAPEFDAQGKRILPSRPPCRILDLVDGATLMAVVGDLPAVQPWNVGTGNEILAVGVLLPGLPDPPCRS